MPSIHPITSNTRSTEISSGRSASSRSDTSRRCKRPVVGAKDLPDRVQMRPFGAQDLTDHRTENRVQPEAFAGNQLRCLRPAQVVQATQRRFQVPGGPSRAQRVRFVEPGPDPGPSPPEGRSVPSPRCAGSPAPPSVGSAPTGGGAGGSRSPRGLRPGLVRRGFLQISRGRRRISRGRRASSGRDRVLHPCHCRTCRATRSRNCQCGRESG